MPIRLVGLSGVHDVWVTSIRQIDKHLDEYRGRRAAVCAKAEILPDVDVRYRLLSDTCDVLLDARLMFQAREAWETVQWWQLDATEIGGWPTVESTEQAAA